MSLALYQNIYKRSWVGVNGADAPGLSNRSSLTTQVQLPALSAMGDFWVSQIAFVMTT